MKILSIIFTSFCLATFSQNSVANDITDLPTRLAKCGQVALAKDRLACFDSLLVKTIENKNPNIAKAPVAAVSEPAQVNTPVAPTKAKVVAPVATVKTQTPKNTEEVNTFAKEHLKKSDSEQTLQSIKSSITKLKKLIRGQWVIDLENGQKWQQKDNVKIKLKVGYTVIMKKGALGTVYLSKEGSKRSMRVKRLK